MNKERKASNPYPDGTRRENACMIVWLRINTRYLPDNWALKGMEEIGLSESYPVLDWDNQRIQGLSSIQGWTCKTAIPFRPNLTIGNILDHYDVH